MAGKVFHLRVDEDLHAAIMRRAAASEWSGNSVCVLVLRQYFQLDPADSPMAKKARLLSEVKDDAEAAEG